ncbi:MAG: metal ABC transporter permease [Actinomycetota bacterium]|nr:metal ABC transporter permease [Actinomycetota bacterium]
MTTVASVAGLSGNPLTDLSDMLAYPFMVNAFRAGAAVAVVAGVVGWFMVLRRQSFAGHTIAVVGFPGAAGAAVLGLAAADGYVAFCVIAALAIAAVPPATRRAFSEESAVTGTVQAVLLGLGYLFVTLYHGFVSSVDALLFGSMLGITTGQVAELAVVAVCGVAAVAVLWRPLLLASVVPDLAEVRGVPVRLLSTAFLVLLGLAAAAASQITGSLLVFALLVMPAATAQRLTARPLAGVVASAAIGLVVTWAGLAVAYYSPYPIGFWITTLAFAAYLAAHLVALVRERRVRGGRSLRRPLVVA